MQNALIVKKEKSLHAKPPDTSINIRTFLKKNQNYFSVQQVRRNGKELSNTRPFYRSERRTRYKKKTIGRGRWESNSVLTRTCFRVPMMLFTERRQSAFSPSSAVCGCRRCSRNEISRPLPSRTAARPQMEISITPRRHRSPRHTHARTFPRRSLARRRRRRHTTRATLPRCPVDGGRPHLADRPRPSASGTRARPGGGGKPPDTPRRAFYFVLPPMAVVVTKDPL